MSAADDAVDAGLLSFTTGDAIGTGGFIETPNQRLNVRNVQVITTPQQLAAGAARPARLADADDRRRRPGRSTARRR